MGKFAVQRFNHWTCCNYVSVRTDEHKIWRECQKRNANTTKMSDEEQLELDYRYIKERSVRTDLKIIFATVKSIFKGGNC